MSLELQKDSLEKALNEHEVIFLDFYATWCGPCVQFSPIFHRVASLYQDKAFFGTINVDNLRDIAINYRISSIPTLLCIKNKAVAWRHSGTLTEQAFKEKVESLI